MSYVITRAVPQLPALDFVQSKEYYLNELGCTLQGEYPDLLILSLEGIELHLWLCADKTIPEASSCYFRVEDIDSLYERFRHVSRVVVPLQRQPWGIREFYLMDNSGNLLKFGEEVRDK